MAENYTRIFNGKKFEFYTNSNSRAQIEKEKYLAKSQKYNFFRVINNGRNFELWVRR